MTIWPLTGCVPWRGNIKTVAWWWLRSLNQINIKTFSNWNKTDERPHAELITSPPAGAPNIKLGIFAESATFKGSNALMRTKGIRQPSVWCLYQTKIQSTEFSHISNKWFGPRQLVSTSIFIYKVFKQILPPLPKYLGLSGFQRIQLKSSHYSVFYSYMLIEGFCCGAPLKCDKSLDDIILRGVFYLSKCSRALNREISRCKKQLKKSLLIEIERMGHNSVS